MADITFPCEAGGIRVLGIRATNLVATSQHGYNAREIAGLAPLSSDEQPKLDLISRIKCTPRGFNVIGAPTWEDVSLETCNVSLFVARHNNCPASRLYTVTSNIVFMIDSARATDYRQATASIPAQLSHNNKYPGQAIYADRRLLPCNKGREFEPSKQMVSLTVHDGFRWRVNSASSQQEVLELITYLAPQLRATFIPYGVNVRMHAHCYWFCRSISDFTTTGQARCAASTPPFSLEVLQFGEKLATLYASDRPAWQRFVMDTWLPRLMAQYLRFFHPIDMPREVPFFTEAARYAVEHAGDLPTIADYVARRCRGTPADDDDTRPAGGPRLYGPVRRRKFLRTLRGETPGTHVHTPPPTTNRKTGICERIRFTCVPRPAARPPYARAT